MRYAREQNPAITIPQTMVPIRDAPDNASVDTGDSFLSSQCIQEGSSLGI